VTDHHDCGSCPLSLGCFGGCAREHRALHDEATRNGQRELVMPLKTPGKAPVLPPDGD
jgi:hypothetical protein